jgi:hypothetical protein
MPAPSSLNLRCTAGLSSSRSASEAIQPALGEFKTRIFRAASTAAWLSLRLRFPIWRSAQFTAFRT